LEVDSHYLLLPKETWCEGVDWLELAQDSLQQQTLVNKVITLGAGEKEANFLTNKATLLLKPESGPSK
jgi:hypothetical protein